MTPRKYNRGTRRPGRSPIRTGRKIRTGGGGKKGGACSFSLPLIPVGLARGVLAAWHIRSMEATR